MKTEMTCYPRYDLHDPSCTAYTIRCHIYRGQTSHDITYWAAVIEAGHWPKFKALQWRHNEHDGVSNHQPNNCLLNRLFRCRSKNTSKLHVTGLCAGNSPVTSEFPTQTASDEENVSIWWRHHDAVRTPWLRCAGVTRISFVTDEWNWFSEISKTKLTTGHLQPTCLFLYSNHEYIYIYNIYNFDYFRNHKAMIRNKHV